MKKYVFAPGTYLHKFYLFCLTLMGTFTLYGSSVDRYVRYNGNVTDICRVIRCIIMMPVIIALNLLVYGVVVGVLVLPFVYFGVAGTLRPILIGMGIFATLFAVTVFLVWFFTNHEVHDFAGLCYHSIKDRICFQITFGDNDYDE